MKTETRLGSDNTESDILSMMDCADLRKRVIKAVNYHERLANAIEDLLSTEECICDHQGTCSLCLYQSLLEEVA